ncbi:MAG: hypothetical protein NTX22_16160 [Ignavibacteriales bacterium]|nr:hypothetical protein [Ignavibacteriales bacterium]
MTGQEFISEWVNKLSSEKIKNFPDDFIDSIECTTIKLPDKNLVLGQELFGKFEILDKDGNSIMLVDDLSIAKYILYSNRYKSVVVTIPKDKAEIKNAVKVYEKLIDGKLKAIEKEFKKQFPKSANLYEVSNKIFNSLNLKRY